MTFRFAPTAAFAACATMAAAPLAAAELPVVAAPVAVATARVFNADAVNAHQYRYYRRHRTDAGDVIGAVVAIGAIAAIASAVSKASTRDRTRGYPYPESYPNRDRTYDYRNGGYDARYDGGSRGLDRAVDLCAQEIERNARIDTVDNVNRTGDGWSVTGRLRTGAPFTCSIGADGRIQGVDYGQRGAIEDRQWGDDSYAAARAAQDAAALPAPAPEAAGDDDRYQTGDSPDVSG